MGIRWSPSWLCHHSEQGARADRAAGMPGDQRPACLEYLSAGKDWPGLRSVAKVTCRREKDTGITMHCRYYISSLAGSAEQMLRAARAHWSIENLLHWSLDVTFRKDQSRMRKGHSPRNWRR